MIKTKCTLSVLLGILIMEMFAGGTQGAARAETIILKSGKTVQGKVIEKTAEYVRFDFSGVELKYYLDEIASIDTEPVRIEAQTAAEEIPDTQGPGIGKKEVFENEEWGFSLAYPPHWQPILPDNLKKVMIAGFTPRETSAVTVQIQAGKYSPAELSGKTTLADLIDISLKPAPDLKKETVKPVTLRFETGYLVRYSYKTVEAIYDKNIEGPLYIPIKIIFDYYFFSPGFTSQGRDRRSFLIELSYLEYEDASTEVDSAKNRNKIYEWNSYYKNENKKTERLLWEANEIINSFHYSDKPPDA